MSRSILSELDRLTFPDDVKSQADTIYKRLDVGTNRGKKRKKLIFYCVYNAYKEIGIKPNPKKIAEEIGIKPGEMSKALSMFSEVQTGYKSLNVLTRPEDLIVDNAKNLGFTDEAINSLLEFCTDILTRHPELREKFPQTVAAGLLKYFMVLYNIPLKMRSFAAEVRLSEATINNTFKLIQKLDNSD